MADRTNKKKTVRENVETRMMRDARERRKREREILRRDRMSAFAHASPVLTVREAACYCNVSYSYLSKTLARFRRGNYIPPSEGVDLMQAGPEKLGHSWFFLREDLDRVLGIAK